MIVLLDEVIVDDNLCFVQNKFPKSKKKRIRKKWKNSRKNYKFDLEHIVKVGDKFYMSRYMWNRIERKMKNSIENKVIGINYEEKCEIFKDDNHLTGFDKTLQHTTDTRKDSLTPAIFLDNLKGVLCCNRDQRFSVL